MSSSTSSCKELVRDRPHRRRRPRFFRIDRALLRTLSSPSSLPRHRRPLHRASGEPLDRLGFLSLPISLSRRRIAAPHRRRPPPRHRPSAPGLGPSWAGRRPEGSVGCPAWTHPAWAGTRPVASATLPACTPAWAGRRPEASGAPPACNPAWPAQGRPVWHLNFLFGKYKRIKTIHIFLNNASSSTNKISKC